MSGAAAADGAVMSVPRGRVRADLVYLGWQQISPLVEPGPAPQPPALTEPDTVSPEWVAAQHRVYRRFSRPARLAGAASVLIAAAAVGARLAGLLPSGIVLTVGATAGYAAVHCGLRVWRARTALIAALRVEDRRVSAFAEVQRRQFETSKEQHAQQVRAWRQHSAAARRQPHWYPVTLPTTLQRVDVAGGTMAGWSALLTMISATRLAAGGDVTVLDLTEGGVAADLLAVAHRVGIRPLVFVLPADLPRLELGARLPPELLADVLAQTVSGADGPTGSSTTSPAELARDAALIGSVLRALGEQVSMPELIAGLRALGQMGGPAEHLGPGGLTGDQLARLSDLAGRAAGSLAAERAWGIEARLRVLTPLWTSLASVPASRLTVTWLDRRAPAVSNSALAAYVAIAQTAELRQANHGGRWQQTVCVLGAERLPGPILDRLCDAAEVSGAGLVLGYRSIPAHVRERLGRGDAAVGFMRLGNADDARLAAEQIGAGFTFVVSQLTDTVGTSVSETVATSYTSTAGTADSSTGSRSVTVGASTPIPDFGVPARRDLNVSTAACDSRSVTAGISAGTSWGWSTARAMGATDSAAITAQRSRESLVEPHELQQLPQSAVLLCYPAPGGRQVLLADANPAIMTLPTATLAMRPTVSAAARGPARATQPEPSARM